MALTDKQIQALKPRDKNYRVADAAGLCIEVTTTGYKSFRYRYRFGGKLKMLVLGAYPDLSLAAARIRAAEARSLLDEGRDPAAEKRADKQRAALDATHTFDALAREWLARASVKMAPSTKTKTEGFLNNWINPAIGNLPVSSIKAADIVALVRRVEASGAVEVPGRIHNLCSRIFRYGVALGVAERDPASDLNLADLIHRPPAKHRAALLDAKSIGAALRTFDGYDGSRIVRAYLQLLPLVFTRPGELRAARWQDVDLVKNEWRYTATKTGIEMIVALPPQALAILAGLRALTGEGVYLFPNARHRDRPMSDNAAGAALRAMGYDTSVELTSHGWRATARTLLVEELGYDPAIVEMQLGHAVRDPNGRAYNRTQFLDKRRQMLAEWANFLDTVRLP